ncbi:MAG: ATP-binding cassette domain-containing protein, partial [Clostridia bacterium]
MKKPRLEFRNISASTAGRLYVRHVTLTVFDGEYVGMVGADGSGKLTLFHLLTGEGRANEGCILLDGVPFAPRNIRDAQKKRLFTMAHKSTLIHSQTIAENLFLNHCGAGFFHTVNDALILDEGQTVLERFGVPARASDIVESLSEAMRCVVELVKFAMLGARV